MPRISGSSKSAPMPKVVVVMPLSAHAATRRLISAGSLTPAVTQPSLKRKMRRTLPSASRAIREAALSRPAQRSVRPPGVTASMLLFSSSLPASERSPFSKTTCTALSYVMKCNVSAAPRCFTSFVHARFAKSSFCPCMDPERSSTQATLTGGRRVSSSAVSSGVRMRITTRTTFFTPQRAARRPATTSTFRASASERGMTSASGSGIASGRAILLARGCGRSRARIGEA
mmetsp:Transcript_128196/g.356735  ORF Transcript_128196/g.356735 Transcript_128196/m.356735 type:complete len:230 (-) Transcript_128196:37-726(-)